MAGGHDLHGRDLTDGREDDLRQGGGAADPAGLFNASLDGNTRRAIDFREGDPIDDAALTALVHAAMALNTSRAKR